MHFSITLSPILLTWILNIIFCILVSSRINKDNKSNFYNDYFGIGALFVYAMQIFNFCFWLIFSLIVSLILK